MNEQTNQRCNIDFNIAINVVSAATSFSFGLLERVEELNMQQNYYASFFQKNLPYMKSNDIDSD